MVYGVLMKRFHQPKKRLEQFDFKALLHVDTIKIKT